MDTDVPSVDPDQLSLDIVEPHDGYARFIGRTARTSKIHLATLMGSSRHIMCRYKGKHLTLTNTLATVTVDDGGSGIIAALSTFHPHPDQLCTHCFRGMYDTVTIRLSHAARASLARQFYFNAFTENTKYNDVPQPDDDGYHHIPLSYHARSVIAGLVAPQGDQEGEVWHDGIVTTAWDEIAAAFPRSLAAAGKPGHPELATAFPPHWFTPWAAAHPYDPEADDDPGNYYDPDWGC